MQFKNLSALAALMIATSSTLVAAAPTSDAAVVFERDGCSNGIICGSWNGQSAVISCPGGELVSSCEGEGACQQIDGEYWCQ